MTSSDDAPIPIDGPLDSEDIAKEKAALRREMKARVAAMSAEERFAAGERVSDNIRALDEWRTAKAVLFYHALPDELNLDFLMDNAIQSGREVLLPVCNVEKRSMRIVGVTDPARDLREGAYGIMEPAHGMPLECVDTLDLVLVPGRAFDSRGGRLGRGKGYYDGFLGALRPRRVTFLKEPDATRPRRSDGPFKLGVAFARQMVETVPMQARDVRMDAVITEDGMVGRKTG